ncbi:unnamed protein product [Urochloa decumbens]|uniref:Protein kinase domain-containing protein n=1 Tax=Urochloa decumbens TaxID=240449 RepID=A0ABC9A3C9_9POAL
MLLPLAAAIALAVAAITATTSIVGAQDTAQEFLDLQNAARAEVGVAPLSWDDTVAAYARTYAAERKGDCELLHSGGLYGENIFWGSAGANWTAADAVSAWVSEKQSYNCSDNSCGGQSCGHYTQVVWANTTTVGCATVTCDGRNGVFIVCEYDPPGNLVGQRPYAGCGQFNRSAQISPQDFLTLQNAFRAGLGVGMLSWDSTLAAYAETYAEKRKRDCQKIPSDGPYGENIFQGTGGSGASDALFSWFGEKQYYNCTANKCEGAPCSDYTQLIWANSTRVGCASVTCDNNAGGGTFITCNYDPRGNVAGERPYLGCGKAESTSPADNGNGSIPKVNGNSPSENNSSPSRNNKSNALILPIVLPVVTVLSLVSAISVCIWRRSRRKRKLSLFSGTISSKDIEDLKSVLLDPTIVRAATQNFAEGNKLGEGGFGQVYKGLMPDGQEIAVKRLARGSKQGLRELKNELLLVAKLQHRNLVKLIGACLDGDEKLLVYEYIPNKSLDSFIYDEEKRDELAWETRYKIICGIARGLVYLHNESRVKVIHRDLKPSNILLEKDMNPKISDFGLASVFEDDHSKHVTRRVAGTYGYMAPEYAVLGHVSTKSDVFSFGVIILEFVTGRRNSVSSSDTMMAQHLLSYVWENWTRGTITGIVDPSLQHNCAENMVLKCAHIGLLCVQENPSDRPSMSNVILMLVGRSTTMPAPSRPAFLFRLDDTDQSHHDGASAINQPGRSNKSNSSLNKVTITELEPR